jgi:hypothetical protein
LEPKKFSSLCTFKERILSNENEGPNIEDKTSENREKYPKRKDINKEEGFRIFVSTYG